VDRHRIEMQIRVVVVTFRAEQRRRDAATMEEFRDRARSILDGLTEEARLYPDLEARLFQARNELDGTR
jgi:hypothetical protein